MLCVREIALQGRCVVLECGIGAHLKAVEAGHREIVDLLRGHCRSDCNGSSRRAIGCSGGSRGGALSVHVECLEVEGIEEDEECADAEEDPDCGQLHRGGSGIIILLVQSMQHHCELWWGF